MIFLLDAAYRLATGGGTESSDQKSEQGLQHGKTEGAHGGQCMYLVCSSFWLDIYLCSRNYQEFVTVVVVHVNCASRCL